MLLVVDDYVDTRRVLVRLLKMEGYHALAVEDGRQALTFLKTYRPSLILLDYGMPGMDGLEVLTEIRKTPDLAKIPVLMFSAYDGPMRENAIAAGADGYVIKGTLDWSDLRKEILRLAGPPSGSYLERNEKATEGLE